MKTAQAPDGTIVTASQEAPPELICSDCGGTVILRRRKLMNNGGYSYFWRHLDNKNRDCPGRSRRR